MHAWKRIKRPRASFIRRRALRAARRNWGLNPKEKAGEEFITPPPSVREEPEPVAAK